MISLIVLAFLFPTTTKNWNWVNDWKWWHTFAPKTTMALLSDGNSEHFARALKKNIFYIYLKKNIINVYHYHIKILSDSRLIPTHTMLDQNNYKQGKRKMERSRVAMKCEKSIWNPGPPLTSILPFFLRKVMTQNYKLIQDTQ